MSKSDQEVHTELCDEITASRQRIKQLEELVDAIIGIDSVKQARNDSLLSHKDEAITLLVDRISKLERLLISEDAHVKSIRAQLEEKELKLDEMTIECGRLSWENMGLKNTLIDKEDLLAESVWFLEDFTDPLSEVSSDYRDKLIGWMDKVRGVK